MKLNSITDLNQNDLGYVGGGSLNSRILGGINNKIEERSNPFTRYLSDHPAFTSILGWTMYATSMAPVVVVVCGCCIQLLLKKDRPKRY